MVTGATWCFSQINGVKCRLAPYIIATLTLYGHASRKFPVIDGTSANSGKFPGCMVMGRKWTSFCGELERLTRESQSSFLWSAFTGGYPFVLTDYWSFLVHYSLTVNSGSCCGNPFHPEILKWLLSETSHILMSTQLTTEIRWIQMNGPNCK